MRIGVQITAIRAAVLIALLGSCAAIAGVASIDRSARTSAQVSSVRPAPSVHPIRSSKRIARTAASAEFIPVREGMPRGVAGSNELAAVTDRAHVVMRVMRDTQVRSAPGGAVIGMVPARSPYLGTPMTVWVQRVSAGGSWGYVQIPWSWPTKSGWVRLHQHQLGHRDAVVVASLRDRRVRVFRAGNQVVDVPAAVGAPGSPTPTGSFFVAERVPISPPSRSFGSYAFGLSAIQPRLPAGWSGGNQMAIHGTGDPGTIGKAASAGCLRVSEGALDAMRPLLLPGTPVIIRP